MRTGDSGAWLAMIIERTDPELDELVDRIAECLQLGVQVDLAALIREHPQHEQQLRAVFHGVNEMARLSRHLDGQLEQDRLGGSQSGDGQNALATLGDYDILEEIGRGGMGVVYRARQRTLDRIVALKVLPLASLADSQQLTRFHNEARAAATLKHPHIVPAYSAGTERGVHYYSMQYIAGPTLAQMLELLRADESPKHADSERDSVLQHARRLGQFASSILNDHRSSRATYCRTLAGWGWQVAEALSNAHQHGIVHRDIKPGNLLLDEAGSVWITDFGLARLELGATITSSGAVVGTWRYMSPEQATGNNLIVDHRTDIYSLGVTLYEALTLKPAFAGDSRGELVQQIAASNPPTPRSIDATIPVDLETIVLKAMQKEPRDRYLTAADLADDLRRFLDGQPIRARRVSILRRWRYGVRRHSELAFGVAVALLLTLSLSVAAVWIGRAQRQAQSAIAGQEAALRSANEKTRIARQAADAMYRDMPRHEIANAPESSAVQRRLLESALSIYQQLSQDASQHPSARLETGLTLAHMQEVLLMSGRTQEALEAAEQAIDVLAPVAAAQPDNVKVLGPLGSLYHDYALRLGRLGRTEDAITANRKAAVIFEQLLAQEPQNPSHEIMLASIELNQSDALRYLGKLPEAETSARRAWESASAVTRKLSEFDWSAWGTSFNAAGNLASILNILGRSDEAEQLCRQAVMECEALRSQYPKKVSITRLAGKLHGALGGQLAVQGKLPEAESELRTALAAIEQTLPDGASPATLFRAESSGEALLEGVYDPGAFLSHAQDQVRLGQVLRGQDKLHGAVNVLREAMFVLGQLMARHPDSPSFQGARAQGEWELARLLGDRDPAEAEQHFRTAAELYGGFVQRYPQDPRNHVKLGQVLNNLGCLLVDAGNLAEAQQTFEAAVRHEERALELRPDVAKARHTLDRLLANLTLLLEAGSASVTVQPMPGESNRQSDGACRLQLTTSIHSRCRLTLQRNTATWEFMPAVHPTEDLTGPGDAHAEVCSCGARIEGRGDLDVVRKTVSFAATIPSSPCDVRLQLLQGPGTVQVVQQPAPANHQTVIIEFDNVRHQSSCLHVVMVDFVPMNLEVAAETVNRADQVGRRPYAHNRSGR